jgi:translation elongation factor EF-Tu-like GTPase
MEKKEVGKVTHYFGKIGVAALRLSDTLRPGDQISIEGAHTNFEQTVESIQIDRNSIPEATAGQEIGIKVKDRVREGDTVFKVIV